MVELIHRVVEVISIHALREEGDSSSSTRTWGPSNFYPRPPRGGRPSSENPRSDGFCISIHALREEGDPLSGVASKVC